MPEPAASPSAPRVRRQQSWESLAESKRKAIQNSIPSKWRLGKVPSRHEQKDVTGPYIRQFLTEREIDITETDAVGLVKELASGSWKAVDVTEAFCHRASLAHQLTNCLHETFFDAALSDAQKLDDYYAENKTPIGPLHGLPISLKDQFHVKDVETCMGYVGWINTFEGKKDDPRKGTFESELVRELRSLGAILYCKTSVPHTLMSGETVNNIIGYTWNPKNRNLCSGGSSGGEGALIGLRGSPGGFGTDIGGSVRIPAAFNGLYGLRPSSGRLPYQGMPNSMDGQNTVLSVVGPLATSAGSVKLLFKSILSQHPWLYDPLVIELPWRDSQEQEIIDLIEASADGKGKLAFGVMRSDGIITPHPPVTRALQIVTDTLTKLGHKIIEWKPPFHKEGIEYVLKTWTYDGGEDIHRAFQLSGEPLSRQVAGTYKDKPWEQCSASEISANNVANRGYCKRYMDYWNSTSELSGTGRPVDAFIAPLAPYAAARPTKYGYYGYSMFVNGLDYTSVVVPVTSADKVIDVVHESFQPISTDDQKVFDDYDPKIFDGAHVAVQLVGRRLQEEKMLALAEYVSSVLAR